MGAQQFTTYQHGDDLDRALIDARTTAQYEHGHAGYTGTIAEKSDVVVVSAEGVEYDDALVLADELMARDDERVCDKWGPAGAIRVRGGIEQVFVGGLVDDPNTGWQDRERDGWLFFGYAPC